MDYVNETKISKMHQGQFGGWSELPTPAVENVFSCLNRSDQIGMSLVCRNWHNGYSSPSLWRRLKFRLPDRNINIVSPTIFAMKFGAMFHHVEITFEERIRRPELDTVLNQLKGFLQIVSSCSKLLSISFLNMYSYLRRVDDGVSEEIFHSVLNLLISQSNLQYIEFSNSQFRKAEAEEILNAIFMNNSKTLRSLVLTKFVMESIHDELSDNIVADNLKFMTLMNLQKWKVDYSKIFENIMLSLYENTNRADLTGRKGCLKEMELFCDSDSRVHYLTIQPAVWKHFREVFPDLKIHLTVQSKSNSEPRNIEKFIVPQMPLIALDFQWTKVVSSRSDIEIGTLLRYITLCEINKSLEVLRIAWLHNSSNLAPDLISFMNSCPGLKALELLIQHPVTELDTVFNSWIEKRPASLQTVHIDIMGVRNRTEGDEMLYAELKAFYEPLQSLNITLCIVTN